jgi:hypothetical protein
MARFSTWVTKSSIEAVVVAIEKGVRIEVEGYWLTLSREEAAQLAVDLLNAVEATPIDAEVIA